jgi:hypothetical protein
MRSVRAPDEKGEESMTEQHSPPSAEDTQLLERYQQLRTTQRQLNQTLVERLAKTTLMQCAKTLGLVKEDQLILEAQEQMPALLDYCLYDYRPSGKNAVERYLEDSSPASDSDEMILLQAMIQARYSMFEVTDYREDAGVYLRDLVHGDSLFLFDKNMSKLSATGIVFATRVLFLPDLAMSSGASLKVVESAQEEIDMRIDALLAENTPEDLAQIFAKDPTRFPTLVMRACLLGP